MSRLRDALRKLLWPNLKERLASASHLRTRDEKRAHITGLIELGGFNWLVVIVAGSGFFTDSYNLFATNVILPSLRYIYWQKIPSQWHETIINEVTLCGSIVGQLLFGYLADRIGRQSLYGVELVLVIFATIGAAQSSNGLPSSEGLGNSMSLMAWICVWRFVVGIGIGAEYPLSAVICAEWAPDHFRAKMMAAVFFMQPLGQLVSAIVGLSVAVGVHNQYNGLPDKAVDQIWRTVIGVGAFPAILAVVFRFTITDSGIYTLDVKNEGNRAIRETENHFYSREAQSGSEIELNESGSQDGAVAEEMVDQDEELPTPFSRYDLCKYFIHEGNWRYLAGTSTCWFLLDLAFYGLGMYNPLTLSQLWDEYDQYPANGVLLYSSLLGNAKRSIVTVSIGSILGSLTLIYFVNSIPRRKMLIWSFLILAFLLMITGISFWKAEGTRVHPLTIVLYALCQFMFNLGPNTLTFIIPAEIFPTRYRGTCHGISAASGKLGSVIVLAVLHATPGSGSGSASGSNYPRTVWLGGWLIGFAGVMASGALFAWAWVPEVQEWRRKEEDDGVLEGDSGVIGVGKVSEVEEESDVEPRNKANGESRKEKWVLASKTLEILGEGRAGAQKNGEIIGMKVKIRGVLQHYFG